jgi:anti-anti-sigma factor
VAGAELVVSRRPDWSTDLEVYLLAGAIDGGTVPVLRRLVRDLEIREAPLVLLDLTRVAVICAEGVRELAYATVHARATRRCLACVTSAASAARMLAVSALADRLVIHRTVADAGG